MMLTMDSALVLVFINFLWAVYVQLRVTHAPGMPGKFSPPLRVSNPGMHHGTCVGDRENVPGIPGACATHNFTYLVGGLYLALLFVCSLVSFPPFCSQSYVIISICSIYIYFALILHTAYYIYSMLYVFTH